MDVSIPELVPTIAFVVLAGIALLAALGVVMLKRITHSALSLAVSFLAVAGLYALLQAEFIFAVQILIYVGAVMVLLLFAIMLTRESQSRRSNADNRQNLLAAGVAVVVMATLAWVLTGVSWPTGEGAPTMDSTQVLGDALFNASSPFILAFEVASLVLLVAMIGAIVIARED